MQSHHMLTLLRIRESFKRDKNAKTFPDTQCLTNLDGPLVEKPTSPDSYLSLCESLHHDFRIEFGPDRIVNVQEIWPE